MEELKDVTASQEPVVAAQTPEEVTSEVTEESTQDTAVQEAAKPAQTPEQDAQYKRMRLRAEAEAREQFEREKQEAIDAEYARMYEGKTNEFTGKPIRTKAEHDEYVRMTRISEAARQRGISYEEQQAFEEKIREEIKSSDPDIVAQRQRLADLENKERERTFSADLEAIKKAYPDEKAETVGDLGLDFLKLMATGLLTPIQAYETLRNKKADENKMPPSTGDIKSAPSEQKDFYTPDEVDKFTSEDYDRDPKLFEKVRRSMLKWK